MRTRKGTPTTRIPARKKLTKAARRSSFNIPGSSRQRNRPLAARSCFSTSRTPSPSTGAGGGSWRQHSSRAVTKKQPAAPQSTRTSPTAA